MINKEDYCKFIYNEGKKLESIYGDLWISSLINEKNFNKSPNLHRIFGGNCLYISHRIWKHVFYAFLKYFRFVFAKLYFRKRRRVNSNRIIFSYYDSHVKFFTDNINCYEIVMPQKPDYKKVKKEGVSTIYSFVCFMDFLAIPILYIYNLTKLIRFASLNSVFYNNIAYKTDFLKSFVGDVCIENLFYSRIFKRINKSLEKINCYSRVKIYYVYEGQGWEKLLNKYLNKHKRTGIVCSIVSENLINFFPVKEDYKPNAIAVLSNKQRGQFSKYYSNVFVYGAGRYKYLEAAVDKCKLKGAILILLPYDKYLSLELLKFTKKAVLPTNKTYIRTHPKIKNNYDLYYKVDRLSLDKSLDRSQIVITTGDTSTIFDALFKGCLVINVDFKNYVDLSCVENEKTIISVSNSSDLSKFICSNFVNKLKFSLINSYTQRTVLLNEYFDFSVNEKQMADRLLNA